VDSTWPNLTKIGPRSSSAWRRRTARGAEMSRQNIRPAPPTAGGRRIPVQLVVEDQAVEAMTVGDAGDAEQAENAHGMERGCDGRSVDRGRHRQCRTQRPQAKRGKYNSPPIESPVYSRHGRIQRNPGKHLRRRQHLTGLLRTALASVAPAQGLADIVLERPKQASHGDFASNLAMQLARELKTNPRQIAERIVRELPPRLLSRRSRSPAPASSISR
jgi:hypothetical protein